MAELFIPTDGPCAGHPCDNCGTCKRGHCCRRDNPDYKLPSLGEWDEPIHGELGVLTVEDDLLQCHCCGEFYSALQTHVFWKHDLTADEYRSIFGLNRNTGLWSQSLKDKIGKANQKRIDQIKRVLEQGRKIRDDASDEQKFAWRTRNHDRMQAKNSHRVAHVGSFRQESLAIQIKRLFADGVSKQDIAKELGVRPKYIRDVLAGVVGEVGGVIVTLQLANEIKVRHLSGESQRSLAIAYGIGMSSINKIVRDMHPVQRAAA